MPSQLAMKRFVRRSAGRTRGSGELYTSAKLLPPNSDILEGRPAIKAFWQAVITMGIRSAKLEIVEVEALGATAIEWALCAPAAGWDRSRLWQVLGGVEAGEGAVEAATVTFTAAGPRLIAGNGD